MSSPALQLVPVDEATRAFLKNLGTSFAVSKKVTPGVAENGAFVIALDGADLSAWTQHFVLQIGSGGGGKQGRVYHVKEDQVRTDVQLAEELKKGLVRVHRFNRLAQTMRELTHAARARPITSDVLLDGTQEVPDAFADVELKTVMGHPVAGFASTKGPTADLKVDVVDSISNIPTELSNNCRYHIVLVTLPSGGEADAFQAIMKRNLPHVGIVSNRPGEEEIREAVDLVLNRIGQLQKHAPHLLVPHSSNNIQQIMDDVITLSEELQIDSVALAKALE